MLLLFASNQRHTEEICVDLTTNTVKDPTRYFTIIEYKGVFCGNVDFTLCNVADNIVKCKWLKTLT